MNMVINQDICQPDQESGRGDFYTPMVSIGSNIFLDSVVDLEWYVEHKRRTGMVFAMVLLNRSQNTYGILYFPDQKITDHLRRNGLESTDFPKPSCGELVVFGSRKDVERFKMFDKRLAPKFREGLFSVLYTNHVPWDVRESIELKVKANLSALVLRHPVIPHIERILLKRDTDLLEKYFLTCHRIAWEISKIQSNVWAHSSERENVLKGIPLTTQVLQRALDEVCFGDAGYPELRNIVNAYLSKSIS